MMVLFPKSDLLQQQFSVFRHDTHSFVHHAGRLLLWWLLSISLIALPGCGAPADAPPAAPGSSAVSVESATTPPELPDVTAIVRWEKIDELPKEVALLESVFWEPEDTTSLRHRIFADPIVKNAQVLEVGTGSGLLSLCCLQAGASRVVATDLNPAAVQNAFLNAAEMGFAERFDVRLVPRRSPGAWTVIEPDARFDLILSNPPWEDSKPVSVDQFALYDPDFELLNSLVTGARQHLKPNGKMWLAYGCVTAIRKIEAVAREEQLSFLILDDRDLGTLPEVFLPGMLIELRVP